MSSRDELPPFLHGCFDWRVNGLHWEMPTGVDLGGSQGLRAENPWIVVAAVVEHAKRGNHDEAPILLPFARRKDPFALDRVSLLALGDIGRRQDLALLDQVLRGADV